MLVLSRKANESIIIGGNIRVLVVEVSGTHVKLGIEAPREVTINRSEIQAIVDARKETEHHG